MAFDFGFRHQSDPEIRSTIPEELQPQYTCLAPFPQLSDKPRHSGDANAKFGFAFLRA
jgi:hypothetical protein